MASPLVEKVKRKGVPFEVFLAEVGGRIKAKSKMFIEPSNYKSLPNHNDSLLFRITAGEDLTGKKLDNINYEMNRNALITLAKGSGERIRRTPREFEKGAREYLANEFPEIEEEKVRVYRGCSGMMVRSKVPNDEAGLFLKEMKEREDKIEERFEDFLSRPREGRKKVIKEISYSLR